MHRFSMIGLLLCVLPACQRPAQIVVEDITYFDGTQKLAGQLVRDARWSHPRPGVLVVHQWMGPGEHEQERARRLVEAGYVAFIADIYGPDRRPADMKAAAETSGEFKKDRALFRRRLLAALEQLRRQAMVDPANLGAIGFCFGGTGVLELARTGADVKAVVSFHGGLDGLDEAEGSKIRARVLVCHGADDPLVPEEGIAAMVRQFKQGRVDWQMVSYGGAVHSFTQLSAGHDPSRGVAYNASADARSWQAMMAFFEETFSPAEPPDEAAQARDQARDSARVRQMMRSHRPGP